MMKWHNYYSSLMSGIFFILKYVLHKNFVFHFIFQTNRLCVEYLQNVKRNTKKKKVILQLFVPHICKTGPFRFNNMKKKMNPSSHLSFPIGFFFPLFFFLSCCCQLEKSSGWMNQKADAGMNSAITVSRLKIFIIIYIENR